MTTSNAGADVEAGLTYRMEHDGTVTEADSVTDLVSALIPLGYADLPRTPEGDEQALLARWEQSVGTANLVQAVVTAAAVRDGVLDISLASKDVLTALFRDRIEPVEVEEWTQPVPLVLVSTSYAPFTDNTPPIGNVRWINPHTELSYLRSLDAVGVISFDVLEPSEPPPARRP